MIIFLKTLEQLRFEPQMMDFMNLIPAHWLEQICNFLSTNKNFLLYNKPLFLNFIIMVLYF